jgi:phospholipid/cholesterol/gamma-HCH transport system substrate-binding protein
MDKNITLYNDASASIKASGLLGDKYLHIKTGTEKPILKDGDTIKNIVEIVDLDDLTRNLTAVSENINELAKSLNESFGTQEAKIALKESILNLRDITEGLKETIYVNDRKLRNTLDNINSLASSVQELVDNNKDSISASVSNIKAFSSSLKDDGPQLVTKLNKAAQELQEMIQENRPAFKNAAESLNRITTKIDKGEGSLGKLLKDDQLYDSINKAAQGIEKTVSAVDRFRTFITFQTEYLTKPKDGKGYFSVTLQPKPDKYYILGVVGDPLGKVKTTTTYTKTESGTTWVEEDKIRKRIEFTAQIAKRINDFAFRLGLTENTFGFGTDYFFHNDKGKITADVWDFSGDEENAKSPHVKVGIDYYLFKNLFISAGGDNLLNEKWRGGYAGVGVRFEDEDLKYLFGTLPRISAQ